VIDLRNVTTQFVLELGLVIVPGAFIALLTTWFLGFEALSKVNLDANMLTGRDLLVMSGAGVIGIWLGVLTSSLILCTFLRLTPTPPGWTRAASFQGHAGTLSTNQNESDPADVGLEPHRPIPACTGRRQILAGRGLRVR
jgi:hypothetical protein